MADITNQQLLEALSEQIGVITDIMVTKQDLTEALKDYPTKQDLKDALGNHPTKQDLKDALGNYPTKQDLKNELKTLQTQHDRDYGDIRGRLTRAANVIA